MGDKVKIWMGIPASNWNGRSALTEADSPGRNREFQADKLFAAPAAIFLRTACLVN
jgi:hypothetical protein